MQIETTKTFTITFTEEEFQLLIDGIGETSGISRMEAGMTEDQSRFFELFYEKLANVI